MNAIPAKFLFSNLSGRVYQQQQQQELQSKSNDLNALQSNWADNRLDKITIYVDAKEKVKEIGKESYRERQKDGYKERLGE